MSPERPPEIIVSDAIAAAVRRARMLALAEGGAWAVAVAAASPIAGILIGGLVAAWRWRAASRMSVVLAFERAQPASRNVLFTADEIASQRLEATPAVRARVFADAAAAIGTLNLHVAIPSARIARITLLAAAAWGAAAAIHVWRAPLPRGGVASVPVPDGGGAARPRLQVTVAVQPPPYTSATETSAVDPEQVYAIEGSLLLLSIEASADRVTLEHDASTRTLTRAADGRFVDRVRVTRTGYLLVTADAGARRMIPVVVTPDALPAVRMTTPGRDLVYAGGNPRITFDARATDDFGLRSLVLRYTRVSGSGENYEFQEGEIPLAVKRSTDRDWSGSAARTLAELGLSDGDMFVYRAVAADARPGDGSASSDAYFIEVSKLGVAAGDAFTLPEQDSKYALSQQMLIVKTERLHQRRGSLDAADLAEQAMNLAVEQRMIRAEFVFMLGGEVNDEEVEAEQSVELQAGRLQNRGQRDLRAATIAMSAAEKQLTGANTADALVAERAAVTALQRAFSRDRYILRALATRSRLEPARRLTGSLADAAGWRRLPPDVRADRRLALLQDLLRGIAEVAPGPKGPGLPATQRRADPLRPADPAGPADPSGPAGSIGPGRPSTERRAGPLGPADPSGPAGSTGPGRPATARGAGPLGPADPSGSADSPGRAGSTGRGGPSTERGADPLGPADSRGPAGSTGRGGPSTERRAGPLGPAGPRALKLAEEAIRIDPTSVLLRQAAVDLRRAAAANDETTRARALSSAAAAVASEARRAEAPSPLAPAVVAPSLSGAFADALRRRR